MLGGGGMYDIVYNICEMYIVTRLTSVDEN